MKGYQVHLLLERMAVSYELDCKAPYHFPHLN
jgi:hypothetical protein